MVKFLNPPLSVYALHKSCLQIVARYPHAALGTRFDVDRSVIALILTIAHNCKVVAIYCRHPIWVQYDPSIVVEPITVEL